ncbi:hypothetical protein A3K63_00080 [Candidatus Micrarchaeota archaeon RBG_16_49_10]|nr:MAG: hypothetical protein A3K63_00080 [Candidatus Micrarchaeota archaeon RBG_16_49_10]
MARSKLEYLRAPKLIFLWLLGSATALLGGMIAGNARMELGVSQQDFTMSLLISGFLFLVTGISWIYASSEIKDIEENLYEKG